MNHRKKLIIGCSIALVLGIIVSAVFLTPTASLNSSSFNVKVNVAYAYFAFQEFDGNITGLWRNVTYEGENPSYFSNFRFVSYFIVLNITDLDNRGARVDRFQVSAAPYIGPNIGRSDVTVPDISTYRSNYSGLEILNALVSDMRDESRGGLMWNYDFSANSSHLVGVSGLVGAPPQAYEPLLLGKIYVQSHIEGFEWGSGGSGSTTLNEIISLQNFGNEYLYNPYFKNQKLNMYNTLDVSVSAEN
jgi:hypothetical protein